MDAEERLRRLLADNHANAAQRMRAVEAEIAEKAAKLERNKR